MNIRNNGRKRFLKSHLFESDMQAKVLQKKLGHRDITITLNTYTEIFTKFEDTCDENYIDYLEANKVGLQ